MRNLVLYAPPAAGKGTQCEILKEKYNYEILSFGQLLRDARNPETEVGRKIIECQDNGILVPNEIAANVLKDAFDKLEGKLLLIDGFPRSIDQAEMLDSVFTDYVVVHIKVDKELALKRTTGRLTCTSCHKIYNKYFENMTPKDINICDICGSPLEVRSDDNELSFEKRYEVYKTNSQDIINYYNKQNKLYEVDGNISSEHTFNQIDRIINEKDE